MSTAIRLYCMMRKPELALPRRHDSMNAAICTEFELHFHLRGFNLKKFQESINCSVMTGSLPEKQTTSVTRASQPLRQQISTNVGITIDLLCDTFSSTIALSLRLSLAFQFRHQDRPYPLVKIGVSSHDSLHWWSPQAMCTS